MIVGVPRERKIAEKRVGITPDGAHELTKRGHTVLVETNAGAGSYFDDDTYRTSGCKIVRTLAELWNESDLVIKVKEPHESEYEFFRPGLVLFTYLHLAGMPDVAQAMLEGGITGIAYELVQTRDRRLPLLEPMSEVAGNLSILNGSHLLLSQWGGRGVLLGGTVGVSPANVTIIGAGISGRAACEIALGMGAIVTILDVDYAKLERIKIQYQGRAVTLHSTKGSVDRAVREADLLVGAVLIPGAHAPRIVTRDMIRSMKNGSVFVDISIDQGGCAETIRPTSLEEPTYVEEGVIHYGVPNMPAQVPRTSTFALAAATLPYVMMIAQFGMMGAFEQVPELKAALNTHRGLLTNKHVSEAVGCDYVSIERALGEA